MKLSRRAKRMQRNHARHKRAGGLMLVSLMDIFTILVFFLLVNTSTELDPFPDLPYLPDSTAQQSGERTVQIIANADGIQVDNRLVVSDIDAWLNSFTVSPVTPDSGDNSAVVADPLTAALRLTLVNSEAAVVMPTSGTSTDITADAITSIEIPAITVTLLADKALPYKVIDRIARSASDAGYNTLAHATKKQAVTNTTVPTVSTNSSTTPNPSAGGNN